MNKQRRKTIQTIIEALTNLRDLIEEVLDEETCYLENMPDGIRESEKGERAEEAVDNIESASCSLDEVIESLETAIEN